MDDVPVLEEPIIQEPVQSEEWLDSLDEFAQDSSSELEEELAIQEEETWETQEQTTLEYLVIYGSYMEEARASKAMELLPFECSECELLFIEPYHKLVLSKSATMSEAKNKLLEFQEKGINGFIQRYQN